MNTLLVPDLSEEYTMLAAGHSVTDIRNHLGHDDVESTMVYLKLDLSRRRQIQKQFIAYIQSVLSSNTQIDELIDWKNKKDIMR